MSGAAKEKASRKARARCPSRAAWISVAGQLSACFARARARSATQKASKPSATEVSLSELPLASSPATGLRSITMHGQFEKLFSVDWNGMVMEIADFSQDWRIVNSRRNCLAGDPVE